MKKMLQRIVHEARSRIRLSGRAGGIERLGSIGRPRSIAPVPFGGEGVKEKPGEEMDNPLHRAMGRGVVILAGPSRLTGRDSVSPECPEFSQPQPKYN
jgi:hypothetical protein